jgi:hypothetical protein
MDIGIVEFNTTQTVHGLLGYFVATLYEDYVIDTRHNSPTQNAFHWEAFLFPIQTDIKPSLLHKVLCLISTYFPNNYSVPTCIVLK